MQVIPVMSFGFFQERNCCVIAEELNKRPHEECSDHGADADDSRNFSQLASGNEEEYDAKPKRKWFPW